MKKQPSIIYLKHPNNTSMAEDETAKILKDMNERGFPLEVTTSELIKTHGWEVTNQAAFSDAEKGTNRTIDLVAEKSIISKATMGFDIWLIIECKRVTKPWVFYTSDLKLTNEEIHRKIVSSTQFAINDATYRRKLDTILPPLIINNFIFDNKLAPPIFGKLAYSSFEPFTNGKKLSIHKARMQLCNAILYFEKAVIQDRMLDLPYGILFVPIIVLDGRLYTYENNRLSPATGLYYHVTYHGYGFMIEIVTADFLASYLKNIEVIITNFQNSHRD
jgi:hypothetical protein